MSSLKEITRAALAALEAGLSVVPPREDGSKAPISTWKQYQTRRATEASVRLWYSHGGSKGLGVVCGAVSGNLECLEFETEPIYQAAVEAANQLGLGELVERVEAGYSELSPGGGVHWLYRCAEIAGNTKLARRLKRPEEQRDPDDKVKVLIETRGEGGYVITAPSTGRVHPSGRPYRLLRGGFPTIATISPQERAELWRLARSFDRMPVVAKPVPALAVSADGRPGDDYNRRVAWAEVLEPHGWTLAYEQNGTGFWRKPGKRGRGHSATVNHAGSGLLYVFSTSTPFEPERGYSKFAAYALLAHAGDHSAAARQLAATGYGDNERNERDERRSPRRATRDLLSSDSFLSYALALEPAAFHGITGKVVRTLEPHTEADPAGLLLSFLAAVGNIVGPGPHAMAEAMAHPARLNVVLVGRTSKSRKGSALAQIRRLLDLVDPAWAEECILPGLASGEALIAEVRDGAGDDDLGVADKRRLVEEPEFARLLAVAGREGATLSHVIRDCWDGRRLKNRTKRDPLVATGAHISVVGHITREELLRRLDDTEIANGFANRFLFAMVRRSKQLPEGGNLDPAALDDLAVQVGAALDRARRVGLMTRSPAAKELWAKAYQDLTDDSEEGLVASVTARAEAQALRLSVAYALLDGSEVIDVEHLEAALAVWRYCEDSTRLVFGDATGDPVADRLLEALRGAGAEGLDYTDQSGLFGRNLSAARLAHAREQLEARGLAETVAIPTEGRNRMVTRIKEEG